MTNIQDEEERKPLLEDESSEVSTAITIPRCFVVEPMLFLVCFSLFSQMPIITQYIHFVVSQRVDKNGTLVNNNTLGVCSPKENITKEMTILSDRIQEETTLWNTAISLSGGLISLVTVPVLSVYSDKFGRKTNIVLVVVGESVRSCINLGILYFDLPLWVFMIGSVLSGLTGGFGLLFAASFSYIADITTSEQRAVRIALVEVSFGLAGVISSLVIGWWIKVSNSYTEPYILGAACSIVAALYCTFILPEVREPSKEPVKFCKQLGQIFKVFTKPGRRTGVLLSLLAALFLFCLPMLGSMGVDTLYEMSLPFCMDSVMLGYYSAGYMVLVNVGTAVSAKLFTRCMPLLAIALIGLLSYAAQRIMMALAFNVLSLMIAPVFGLLHMSTIPMIRGYLSIQIPQEEQGALFANIGFIEVLCSTIGGTLISAIYYATLEYWRGLVFVIMAAIAIIPMIILMQVDFYAFWSWTSEEIDELPNFSKLPLVLKTNFFHSLSFRPSAFLISRTIRKQMLRHMSVN